MIEDQIQHIDMSNLSDLAREILASSDNPTIAAMASPDLRRANEAARAVAFESQYLRELEHEGPNGIGATVFNGLSIAHWDGSETSQPRTLTMEKTK